MLGESELAAGEVQVKDLSAHEQRAVALSDVAGELARELG